MQTVVQATLYLIILILSFISKINKKVGQTLAIGQDISRKTTTENARMVTPCSRQKLVLLLWEETAASGVSKHGVLHAPITL